LTKIEADLNEAKAKKELDRKEAEKKAKEKERNLVRPDQKR
jgi:hypothetical protein